jgi:hypothetical protein
MPTSSPPKPFSGHAIDMIVRRDGFPWLLGVGPVLYTDLRKPHLLLRYIYDTPHEAPQQAWDIVSHDGGRSWSAPTAVPRLASQEQGLCTEYVDAMLLDPSTGRVLTIGCTLLLPNGPETRVRDRRAHVFLGQFEPRTHRDEPRQFLDDDMPFGSWVSFCRPIFLGPDRLLIPTVGPRVDEHGRMLFYRGHWSPMKTVHMRLGFRDRDGWRWQRSQPIDLPVELSVRGLFEPAVLELRDGRVLAIMRGDNGDSPSMPGFKWISVSDDAGITWSPPQPLRYDDDGLVESSSSGSSLFRCERTGRAFWIGNVCKPGQRANGNQPRTVLSIFELDEDSLSLRRRGERIIDQQGPDDPTDLQLSNFKCYQDRHSGELILLMTRFSQTEHPRCDGSILRYSLPLT